MQLLSRHTPAAAPQTLDLSNNELSGTLPPEWGAEATFPSLQML